MRTWLWPAIAVWLLAGQTPASTPPAAIDALVHRELEARGIPGAAVAVVADGKVVHLKGYGIANVETGTPVDAASVFEIASVTKPFTATAIMLLVEEGRVRLDESIAAYLPEPPEQWRPITVRHLLTHTSGLPVDAIPGAQGSALLNISTRAAYEWISKLPLLFAPGERASYSDAGYFLLGMVIEQASRQTYREFMQTRVLTPFGMTGAGLIDRARILKGRVPVYTRRGGELAHWRRDWQYELPSFFGMYATAGDLAAWDVAARAARVPAPASTTAMLTPARLNANVDALVGGQLYGLGWELGLIGGRRYAAHSGASGAYVLRLVDEALTVVVLTNLDIATGPHAAVLATQIAGVVRPALNPPEGAAVDLEPALTARLQSLLRDVAAGRESAAMTASYAAYFRGLAEPRRAAMARQLSGARPLRFLGIHAVARPWPSSDQVTQVLYYRLEGTVPVPITVGVTAAGRVATLRVN